MIVTTSGTYTKEELEKRDNEIKHLFFAFWSGTITASEVDKMLKEKNISYGELKSLQYEASLEYNFED